MAKPWFRLYRALVDNPKAQRLRPDLFKAWINILCCTEDDGSLPSVTDLCFKLRKSEAIVSKWISELSDAGFIVDNKAHDWAEHQFRSDVSTERVKRFRERSTQRSGNAERNAPDTDTDTDTDVIDVPPRGAPRQKYTDQFQEFWKAYPRTDNMSKSKAFESWKRSGAGNVPIEDMLKAVAGYKAFVVREQARKGGYVVKHAQGWLTERRWEPYLETESIFAAAAPKPDWGDEKLGWTTFKNSIPATVWTSFFAECVASDDGRVLTAPSAFVRDRIEAQYASRLRSIFGPEFQVTLKPVKMSA